MPPLSSLHLIFFLLCVSLLSSKAFSILGNETDRISLLAFKSQITNDPLEVLSSWNDSSHFCEWGGVTCGHKHQRVISLDLKSNDLVGEISPHIGNLSFLSELILRNNSFRGEIPREIGKLFRLQTLRLDSNSLVGYIPRNLSSCSALTALGLHFNNLSGDVPMEVWSHPNLASLVLETNNLNGKIPPSLGNTTTLTELALGENHFTGPIPSTLGQLKSLRYFTIFSNNISGLVPPSVYNLSSLEIIDFHSSHLVGYLPRDIGLNLPNLIRFYIGDNQFQGAIPDSLSNASKLQKFDFSVNQFIGKVPISLGNLNDLERIQLAGNYLGKGKSGDLDFLPSLTNCSNLQILYISSNQFGGSLPSSVGNFSNNLNDLELEDNQIGGKIPFEIERLQNLYVLEMGANFFNGGIPTVFGNLQNLQELSLYGNRLSGKVPSFLSNMSQLYALDLQDNFLEGSIASSLDNPNLQVLDLSYNKFTGIIPKDIGFLSLLSNLRLAHNSLSGSIPLEIGNLKNLLYFDVSDNKLSGVVPNIFSSLIFLQHIELESNFFQGLLPSSLGSLPDLHYLDVSNNDFSGLIPKELINLSVLASLNLSFNNFEGEVPSQGIFRNASAFSVTANQRTCGGIPELGLQKCHFQKSTNRRHKLSLVVILITVGAVIFIGVFVFLYLWRKPNEGLPSESCLDSFIRVSYHDLFKATNGFSLENLVGRGRYGSVYKGIIQQFDHPVAVKVFNQMESGASKTFLAECGALRVVRHRCLLNILTVCSSVDYNATDFKAIVFDFMDNGSLESWLHPTLGGQDSPRNLSLYQRLEVATSVASVLDYLHNHCETPIAHCDLKPSNVLLDSSNNAFVSDFGLAEFIAMTQRSSNEHEASSIAVRGTIGYIPPEYGLGTKVSTQGDVYSYGILLLEIFTGKRPTNPIFNAGISLRNLCETALVQGLMDIIDTHILSEESYYENAGLGNEMRECLRTIIRMGVGCSADVMTERMDIKDVLKEMISLQLKLNPILNSFSTSG